MSILRRLLGVDFPDAAVGQIWRSRHNGECMRVQEVKVLPCGAVIIYTQTEAQHSPLEWGIGQHYATGMAQWRRRLREEARERVGGIEPPKPWPHCSVNPLGGYQPIPRPGPIAPPPYLDPLPMRLAPAMTPDEERAAARNDICPNCAGLLRLVHEGDGYLWKQCRNCRAVAVVSAADAATQARSERP